MTTATTEKPRELVGTKTGLVTSDKRDKSRTVEVRYQFKHPKYGKIITRSNKFQVHDEQNTSKLGDMVEIVSCRPVSKTKTWRLVKVVEAAKN
ncbi:MAG: 30S ribosomal protein S17 [Phycisphaera sp.]|nr:30S ribosomal protein S17 [Phycisphaera sp.]